MPGAPVSRSLLLSLLSIGLAGGTPGALRYGAVPAGSSTRPVLLFIHGWNSDGSTWSGGNAMESLATGAGYRTAFLDVYPDQSMWTNAPLINTAVDRIHSRFPGSAVDLICHSKGGVDAQTATVYYGTGAKVNRLITLSSPHYGTPLADLAWSSWAGWLASLIGEKNEGNRVLQTGYMASFRDQTDARTEAHTLPTFTAGGTKAGPLFSSYWFGGIAIGRTSDGVVPTDSSELPYQNGRLFTRYWNHDEVHQGQYAWPYLAANLAQPVAAFNTALPMAVAPPSGAAPDPVLDHLYRGGATQGGTASFDFPVDPGQHRLDLALETAKSTRFAYAVSPSGRMIRFPRTHGREASLLPGGVTVHLSVPFPESGAWRIHLAAQGEDAYLFVASFPDDASRRLPLAQALDLARQPAARRLPLRAGEPVPEVSVATERVAPPLRVMRLPGFTEPVVLNQSLTLRWPDGRERSVVVSSPE